MTLSQRLERRFGDELPDLPLGGVMELVPTVVGDD